MLACLCDLNGTANVAASHKDPESIGPIVKSPGTNKELTVALRNWFHHPENFFFFLGSQSKSQNNKLEALTTSKAYPGYSPDLALNDFWAIPKIDPNIKG